MLIAISLAALASCTRPSATERQLGLLSVPEPVKIPAMDRPVRAQYSERRSALNQLLSGQPLERTKLGEAYGDLGMWYHSYDLLDGARRSYLNATKLCPNDFRWLYYLGLVERPSGRPIRAREFFRRALRLRPDYLPTLVQLAELELELGRPREAEPLLRLALQQDPRCVRAWFGLGRIALLRRDFRNAALLLGKALSYSPHAQSVHYTLGLALRGLGDLAAAKSHLAQVPSRGARRTEVALNDPLMQKLRLMNQSTGTLNQRGLAELNAGRYQEALATFRTAISASPRRIDVRYNLALTLIQADHRLEAIRELRRILALEPAHVRAHAKLAELLSGLGRFNQAQWHLERAIQADPSDKDAYLQLAKLHRRRGLCDSALPYFARVIELDPAAIEPRYGQLECLIKLGQFEAAATALHNALELYPKDPAFARLRARLQPAFSNLDPNVPSPK
jgi:tetratricopeptide (TPR) repeat protein